MGYVFERMGWWFFVMAFVCGFVTVSLFMAGVIKPIGGGLGGLQATILAIETLVAGGVLAALCVVAEGIVAMVRWGVRGAMASVWPKASIAVAK